MKRTLIAAAALAALALGGCTNYFSTEISGFVKEAGTLSATTGVNGATVSIYTVDPSTSGATPVATTTTTTYSLQFPGYFDRKIMWENGTPSFGKDGDTITVWLTVSHPDFSATTVKAASILSGNQNFVPDIVVTRTGFYAQVVSGQVGYVTAGPTLNGLNNVRVALDIDDSASEPSAEPYVVYTTTNISTASPTAGTFTFVNVHWTNTSPAGAGFDTKKVKLWIAPPNPYAATSDEVTLNSGSTPNVLSPIVVQ